MATFTVSMRYKYNGAVLDDLIYSTLDTTPAHNVISPIVKKELNKSGSLEFTAHPLLMSRIRQVNNEDETHTLYNHITPLNTFVTVKYDNDVLFHGRVLYHNTDFYRQRKVYCEGDLSFLVDSICQSFDSTSAGITKEQLFRDLIGAHNQQVEASKRMVVGTITAGDKNEVLRVKSDNYIETWSAIENYILKGSRGFIRTRYDDVNDVIYIDWLAGWDREHETTGFNRQINQKIEFGRNLLELDDGINANEIFTRLVPIGKDGLTIASVTTGGSIYLTIEGGESKYGSITRVKEFNDITSASQLRDKGIEYAYYALSGIEHSYSVKAVDLHLCGDNDHTAAYYDPILVGDVVELYSPLQDIYIGNTGIKRVCLGAEYHLADVENTAYSFGIPENADPSESSAQSHSSGSGKSTGSKTFTNASSQITTEKKEAEKTEQKYEWVATRTDDNGKILQQAGITLTASGIIHYATDYEYNIRRQFKRVFIQTTNPSENNEIVEGDVWIVTDGIQTWQQMGAVGRSWADSSDLNWEDYAGCKQYIWKNGAWIILNDSAKELYNTTKIDQNAERIALLADNVEAYHAEFVVSANQIRSEVQDTNNAIGSRITQTAQQIRSEVWASNSTLYSTITQTASNIRAEVADTANGLQSSIEITASAIRSDVSAANSTIYSTIEQTASSIRSSVTDATNSLHSEILQTANSIYQAVYNPSGSVGAMIAIGMSQIRSEVYDPSGSIFSSITQTNNNIQIAIASSKNLLRSEIVASASSIYQAVYSPNSSIMAMVQVNVDQVYQAVYNPSGSVAAMISVGMNNIRSEVYSPSSSIFTTISQTANAIYSAVYNPSGSIAAMISTSANAIKSEVYSPSSSIFTTITQTSGSIMAYAGTKSRVWIQEKDPLLEGEDVHIGDYWIMSTGYRSWGSLNEDNKSWGWAGLHNSDSFNWEDYSGCPIYVLEGGSWTLVSDTRKLVENKTRFDITDEYIRALAKDVDNYRSEFEVRASQIRAEIHDTNNAIGSRVTQTAQQIKSEVWASNSQLYSTISQTATQIRAEVTNSISQLQGSISVQANRINLVVEGTGSNAHINPASITAAINSSGDSSVKISANHIQFDAAHTLDFLSSKMTLSSPAGGGILVSYNAGSEITGCATIQASKLWGLSSIEVGDSTANDKELLVHGLANVSGKVNISNASSSYTYALEVNGDVKFANGNITIGSNSGSWKNVTVLTLNDVNSTSRNFMYTGTGGQSNVLGKILISNPTGTTIHYFGY